MDPSPASPDLEPLLARGEGMRRLARSLVRDAALADDIVQDAWLAALRRPPAPGWSPAAWFTGVTRNVARKALRSSVRRRRHERAAASREAAPSTDDLVGRLEIHARLLAAVRALEEPSRGAILLRYFEGKPPREIARARGIPVATVRSQLRRGLERLRDMLDTAHHGDRRAWAAGLVPLGLRPRADLPPVGPAVAVRLGALAAAVVVAIGALGLVVTRLLDERSAVRSVASVAATPAGDATPAAEEAPEDPPPAAGGARLAAQPKPVPEAPRAPVAEPKGAVATTTTIEGTVVSAETGRFLPFARLTLALEHGEKLLPVEADRDGRFRTHLDATGSVTIRGAYFDIEGSWQLRSWSVEGAEPAETVSVESGATVKLAIRAMEMIAPEGVVEDEHGRPIEGVRIQSSAPQANSTTSWSMLQVETRGSGRFHIPGMLANPGALLQGPLVATASQVLFEKAGFTPRRLNVHDVPERDRKNWRVVLTRGRRMSGRVVDEGGHPIADVEVEAAYGDAALRRTATSDARGRFALEGLAEGKAIVGALDLDHDLEARSEVAITGDAADVVLVAKPIDLSSPLGPVNVFGMRWVDVTDDLRKARGLSDSMRVMVLDPGVDHARFGIGVLKEGYGIYMIGDAKVTSVRDAIDRILADPELPIGGGMEKRVRIVYTYGSGAGTNTQYMSPSDRDLESLRRVRAALR